MSNRIAELQAKIEELKAELKKLQHAAPPEEVRDYSFETQTGTVTLSELFGDKDELILIHNMGVSCPYCTLWADGFEGQRAYLEDRAAFVVCSGDKPEVQASFAAKRGWGFKMISDGSKQFTRDMGYWNEEDGWWPGASGFRQVDGKIYRTGTAIFGPGDDFCPIWPLQDLIGGDKGWEPKYHLKK
ncbi:MAG: DUF899 family protein [Armatimonadetes bacterium]|nr:DUF899 family protein [Armatimonadota bacterium]